MFCHDPANAVVGETLPICSAADDGGAVHAVLHAVSVTHLPRSSHVPAPLSHRDPTGDVRFQEQYRRRRTRWHAGTAHDRVSLVAQYTDASQGSADVRSSDADSEDDDDDDDDDDDEDDDDDVESSRDFATWATCTLRPDAFAS